MSHPGYACLGGMELWNNERVATYATNGWRPNRSTVEACSSCGPELAEALCDVDGVYTNPTADEAPWYATSEPQSGDFGGFYVLAVDGLGPGQVTRSSTPRASGQGSYFGPAVQASPVITVTGILMAKTCCAAGYGLRWLSNVLRGCCGSDCGGDDLTFLDCCPDWTVCEADPEMTPAECLAPYLRTLKGVALVSGPAITARYGSSCCGACDGGTFLQVTFSLSASQPCVYRDPVVMETGVAFGEPSEGCHTWIPTPSGTPCIDTSCDPAPDCLVDPFCTPPPKPPTPPPATNACVCTPFSSVSACIDMPANVIPDFAEGVPIIEVRSGSSELRQISMQFIPNPMGLPPDQLDPCNACGEVTLSRIPPNSVFTMDGTTRTVTITCPGSSPTDASPLLGQKEGRLPFRFPEIECGGMPYTMCVQADAATVAPDASIALAIAVREC